MGEFATYIFISIQTYLYKLGSGEWGPKHFRNHLPTQNNLYIWGLYVYFHPKMQKIFSACLCYYIKGSFAPKNEKIQFLKFFHDYTIVSVHGKESYNKL